MKKELDIISNFKSNILLGENFRLNHDTSIENFNLLIKRLREENLDLLFYTIINKDGIARQTEIYKSLEVEYKKELAVQMLHLYESAKITQELKSISHIFLKGFILAKWLNKDLYKRSVDIDLLVEKNNVNKCSKLLQGMGYEIIPTKINGELSFKNKSGVFIDLHYDLTASSPFIYLSDFNIAKLLEKHASNTKIEPYIFPTFDVNLTFLHLCIHFGVNHLFQNYILLYELISFLKLHIANLDWELIFNYSEKHNLLPVIIINFLIINNASPGIVNEDVINKFNYSPKILHRSYVFFNRFSIYDSLLNNKKNAIKTNDIAILCADSIIKRALILKGHFIWDFDLYKKSFDIS